MFTISTSSFYNIFFSPTGTASEIDQKFRQLKLANQKLARNSRAGNVFESIHVSKTSETSPSENAKVEETILFTREVISQPQETVMTGRSSSNRHVPASLCIVLAMAVLRFLLRKDFP